MLSSEEGLLAVPHMLAPAGLPELADVVVARTLPQIWPGPIHFVPGLRTPADAGPDGWMRADVMRGAAVDTREALAELTRRGLLEPGQEGLVFVWPVWVGGREPLRSLYARWLAGLLEGPVTPLDDELSEAASALGALAVVLVSIDPGRQSDRSTVTEPTP